MGKDRTKQTLNEPNHSNSLSVMPFSARSFVAVCEMSMGENEVKKKIRNLSES